jgi:hypothetical protein
MSDTDIDGVVRLCTFAADHDAIDHIGEPRTEADKTRSAVDVAIRYGIQNGLLAVPADVQLDRFFPTRYVS